MLTWNYQKPRRITKDGPQELYGSGDCLSTDTKPTTGIANGSTLYEMDTGKSYKYDADNVQWREMPSGSGGGGVTFATADEVREALENG